MPLAEALWVEIASAISDATKKSFAPVRKSAVSGGCISEAWLFEGQAERYFVKTGHQSFSIETDGLDAIRETATLRTPQVLGMGMSGDTHWLVLEYVAMGRKIMRFDVLGAQLAAMHRHTATEFGWKTDNLIGSTPQINTASSNWNEFWKTRRLEFQLDFAAENGHDLGARGARLTEQLDALFKDHLPTPSLLHGDLWRGNVGFDETGFPVIFDPAIHYGDREADLAMTELFGGFPPEFYSAYSERFPLDPGYGTRKILYNLYHVLNHLNLFGASYLPQARSMIDKLLAVS